MFIIRLRGVKKDDLMVEVNRKGFRLKAIKRNTTFTAGHCISGETDPKLAKATFQKGILKIMLPRINNELI
ncbi:MAG TPA: Hsp20/alpha crystallin family protein [Candidatus Nanoarchaeia archaeon]|nr:Hsp20/alpha crystallin family protein [Candidatus Nanoarchaeia archaeon]